MPRPAKDITHGNPGRCVSRTPGWILERVSCTAPDGRKRDAQEALDTIADKPWAEDARYIGSARGWHLWERPGPGIKPGANSGRVPWRVGPA